jgi:tetratricopeptide (TPR) repeat protein
MAVCYQSLGAVYYSSGSLPKAIEGFSKALKLSEDSKNQIGIAVACTLLCDANERAGYLEEALKWGHRALSLAERLNDERRIAWASIMLARTLIYLGEYYEADSYAEKALALFEKTGDFRGKRWVISGYQAERAALNQDFQRELESARYAIQASKESGGIQHENAFSFARASEALMRLGRDLDALEHCQQSINIARKMSCKLECGYAYMVAAEIYASRIHEDWEKAKWYLEESLKAFRDVGAQVELGRANLAGARIALRRQDGTARQWAETAMGIFQERGARPLLQEAEQLLDTIE